MWTSAPEIGARPQPRERSDARALADMRAFQMREGADGRAVVDRDAGSEHDIGLDGDVLAEFGVGGKKHRLRRDHGDAGIERGGAQALLQNGFGLRRAAPWC